MVRRIRTVSYGNFEDLEGDERRRMKKKSPLECSVAGGCGLGVADVGAARKKRKNPNMG